MKYWVGQDSDDKAAYEELVSGGSGLVVDSAGTELGDILNAVRERDRDLFQQLKLKEMIREFFDEEVPPFVATENDFVAMYVRKKSDHTRAKVPLTRPMFTVLFRHMFHRSPTTGDYERLKEGFYYTINKHKQGYKTFF